MISLLFTRDWSSNMGKIGVSSDSAYHLLHPKLTVLVTSIDQEKNANIITVAWAMPTSVNPPLVAISVGPSRYSHDLIQETGEFVINIPSQELLEEVKFCGSKSGSSVNKFEETSLTSEDSQKLDTPRISECAANIECEVVDELRTGDHTIFIGKILASPVKEEIFDKDSKIFDLDQFKPVLHLGGPNFATSGKKLS